MASKVASKKRQAATPRERAYIRGRLEGKSKRQAALDAGFPDSMSRNAKQKIDDVPAVRQLFEELLERAGVSDELLASKIADGLDAFQTRFATQDGEITDQVDCIDYRERREMVALVLRVKGILDDSAKVEVNVGAIEMRLMRGRQRARDPEGGSGTPGDAPG